MSASARSSRARLSWGSRRTGPAPAAAEPIGGGLAACSIRTITASGASNGPTEGMNLYVKRIMRSGHGFTNFKHYDLRVLLHAAGVNLAQAFFFAPDQNPRSLLQRVEPAWSSIRVGDPHHMRTPPPPMDGTFHPHSGLTVTAIPGGFVVVGIFDPGGWRPKRPSAASPDQFQRLGVSTTPASLCDGSKRIRRAGFVHV